ncbi:hypothetical protein LXA47_20845 [Massilia sp. P8910]|uniref:hypothetical protein n=1 Tax=Massilia antarctica TaxID=2765360 RepID=UPI001E4AA3A2|nr:hypothetical protein [Massilia antarctica]MCE3606034.1 hypothetical protein [Massilia antarctica]
MKKVLLPTFSYTLKEAIGKHTFITFNAGPGGEVYVLLARDTLDYRTKDNAFASFAKIIPDSPQRYRVLVFRQGELELDLPIHGARFNIHTIQPLGNDLLLACSRSEYRREDDVDLNARVYSRDGSFLREFLLGDGLETIQTTRHGEIWASYFDEGVLGNYGWPDPVGAAGLVAWNEQGEKVYEYAPVWPVDRIIDCYALNVASADDVWCCYYTNFPLVHLHKKRIASTWNVPVSGSNAFAIAGAHVLFAGGYDKRDSFTLVRLDPDGTSMLIDEFELIGDDGVAVKPLKTIGRDAVLYVLDDAVLYEIDLKHVLATRGRG